MRHSGGLTAPGLVARNVFINAVEDVFLCAALFVLIAIVPAVFPGKGTRDQGGLRVE